MALSFTLVAGFAVVLLVLQAIYTTIYNIFFSPLKIYPGPRLWSISRLPFIISQLRGNEHRDILKIHEKFGPVVRIGPNDVAYANDAIWKDAFAHRQGHDEFFKAQIGVPVNNVPGLLTAKRANHARFRRLLSHAFSERGMREQEPRIKSYVDLMISKLQQRATQGPQNMVAWFNWTTFDLIGDLSFGEPFGCLEQERWHPWIESIFNTLPAALFFSAIRDYGLSFLLPILVPKRLLRLRLANYKFCSDKMIRRVTFGTDRGDFFDSVLKRSVDTISTPNNKVTGDPEIGPSGGMVDSKEFVGMTMEELKSNAGTLVLAGSETTATLLAGTTFRLLQNPRVLAKVTSEVRSAFQSEDEITITSTARLTYLLAVLEEAMRTYPPVPTFSGRRVPRGGDTVDGQFLPAGTVCHIVHYAAYNLESNFKRADEFLPERWLGDPEFKDDNRSVFQPFSVGPRNCVGRNLAYAEMRLILSRFLYKFDLAMSEKGDWNWAEKQKTQILWEKGPLLVDLKVWEGAA